MTPSKLDILWQSGASVVYIAQKLQIPVGEVCARLTQGGWLKPEAYPLCRRAKTIPKRIVMERKRA